MLETLTLALRLLKHPIPDCVFHNVTENKNKKTNNFKIGHFLSFSLTHTELFYVIFMS